jgi:DNA repair exonuclease SbcCD ATPase subunit
MTDETTTEQLTEIEGQAEDTPATEYTPPEGWRVLAVGEALREGDVTVRKDGYCYPTERVGGWVGANQRYIRPIEPQPELPADTAEELRSEVSYVQNLLGESRQRVTQLEELVASLRTINAAQEKAVVDAGKANDKHVDTIGQMQRELQQQHRELQKRALRIFDLDTINAAQEKAVVDAGKENTALRRQLAVVKEELTTAAAVSQQLQIELDAAQQVPADSPELLQLRLRLADMTLDRDTCKDAWNQIFTDLTTIKETTKAETVEAITEWLQPFRGCNSPALALLLLEALPHIMRSLTGLADEEIE